MNDWQKYRYLSLATRKRSGAWVETPVWFACEANSLYCFSEKGAGKIKRLNNFSDVKINPCTATGKLLGEWEVTTGHILNPEEKQAAYQALLKKYGIQMRLLDCLSWLSGKRKNRAFIRICLP